MSYLLDTNVVSDLVAPQPERRVIDWFDHVEEDDLTISVVSLAEIRRGIDLLAKGRRRSFLEIWLIEALPARFDDRFIVVDHSIAMEWGQISAMRKNIGRPISAMDAFIAATAICHDLTLVTRNTADFENLDLRLINPWIDQTH